MVHGFWIVLSLLCTPTTATESPALTIMKTAVPEFRFHLSQLIIPTLEIMSMAVSKEIRNKLYAYASEYSNTITKHFTTETEVQILDGKFNDESISKLNQLESEMAVLQYKQHICCLMKPWKLKLGVKNQFFLRFIISCMIVLTMLLRFLKVSLSNSKLR